MQIKIKSNYYLHNFIVKNNILKLNWNVLKANHINYSVYIKVVNQIIIFYVRIKTVNVRNHIQKNVIIKKLMIGSRK